MTDKKRSRKPVFFRPDFRKRAVEGRDYLQALWNKGGRLWEGRFLARKKQTEGQEKKTQKVRTPASPPAS